MDFFFADDSFQKKPSRKDVGGLLAIGGLHVPSDQVAALEGAIRAHCTSIGFPQNERFKWSPGGEEKFQKQNLNDEKRIDFFMHLLKLAKQHGAKATVVISDISCRFAHRQSKTHEEDITALFLERCEWSFQSAGRNGVLIVATPSGGPKEERKFVAKCLDLIQEGTEFMTLKSMAIGVLTAPSKQMRLLQLADIVTSCCVSRISGESNFSPRVFQEIRPILRSDGTRIGGIGLKIHPDFRYANLYHWLLGDTYWRKRNIGVQLPHKGIPYSESACEAAFDLKGAG